MKKITILGVIFILLMALVVPAMAKSPVNNDKGNPGKGDTPVVTTGDGNSESDQEGQQDQNQHQNNSNHGNGNHGNGGNGNQNSSRMRTPFYLQGTIKSIDPVAKTITVTLVHGNARVKQFIGGDLTLQTTETTQYFKINQMDENGTSSGESSSPSLSTSESENGEDGSNRVAITFDQLAVGDIVAIHGNLLNNVFTTRLVTVYVRAPEGEPVGGQG